MSSTSNLTTSSEIDLLDLTCPGCNADLLVDPQYEENRICSQCNRHFWMSARERANLLSRHGAFREFLYAEPIVDPLDQHERLTAADRITDARERSALEDAIVTGEWEIDNSRAIVAILDPVLLPGGIGIISADKLAMALRKAITLRVPAIVFCSGGTRSQVAGLVRSAQALRISGVIAELHKAALPLIAVVTHGTAGNVLSAIVANADLRIAEPDASLPPSLTADIIAARPVLLERISSTLRTLGGKQASDSSRSNRPPLPHSPECNLSPAGP